METLCRNMLMAGMRANGSLGRCQNATRFRKTFSASFPQRAAKHAKPPLRIVREAALEYKPRAPKSDPNTPPKSKTNPLQYRTIPIIVLSITITGFSAYITYLYIAFTKPSDAPFRITPSAQHDVSKQYDEIASTFDDTVNWTEYIMGITSLRKKLASRAVGDVLEVSIGTGRNLEFYSWNFHGHGGVGKVDAKGLIKKGSVRSFTAVDKSAEMLEIAHQKFSKMFPGILGVRWIIADAASQGAIPGPPKNANERSGNLDGKYDTVIQTMGLCSASDPVALLKNLGECVKEEEGRILLLEHGRGRWEWLNGVLDKTAEEHAKSFGCWWNRDMKDIVEESGLEVVKIETPKWWHGGTTWWIELKKPKTTAPAAK